MTLENSTFRRVGFSFRHETFQRFENMATRNGLKLTELAELLIWGADDQFVQKAKAKLPTELRMNKQRIMSELMKLPLEELTALLQQGK
jgi:hypothetical protein